MKKILVTGGAYQGKTPWVKKTFPEYKDIFEYRNFFENKNDYEKKDIYENKNISGYENIFQYIDSDDNKKQPPVFINGFHMIMKDWLQQGKEYEELAEQIKKIPAWVISSDDVGYGLVPVEKTDREWRENTGRALCILSGQADEVYRVYCGIARRIK